MDRKPGQGIGHEDGAGRAWRRPLAAAGADPAKAEAYLDEAIRLARMQAEQLDEERRFESLRPISAR